MIRRDILFFIGIIMWGVNLLFIHPTYNTSTDIYVHMTICTILLVLYMFIILLLEIFSEKVKNWNNKKVF